MYVGHRLLRTQFLPLFVQRCWRKVGITFGRLMRFSRCVSRKRKIPPMQHSDGFCRVNRRQNESGVLRGGICDREYHGLQSTSRWFCKIYCGKAVKVWHILQYMYQNKTTSSAHSRHNSIHRICPDGKSGHSRFQWKWCSEDSCSAPHSPISAVEQDGISLRLRHAGQCWR